MNDRSAQTPVFATESALRAAVLVWLARIGAVALVGVGALVAVALLTRVPLPGLQGPDDSRRAVPGSSGDQDQGSATRSEGLVGAPTDTDAVADRTRSGTRAQAPGQAPARSRARALQVSGGAADVAVGPGAPASPRPEAAVAAPPASAPPAAPPSASPAGPSAPAPSAPARSPNQHANARSTDKPTPPAPSGSANGQGRADRPASQKPTHAP